MTPIAGPVERFLAEDHKRLDALLQRATAVAGDVDRAAYAEFRAGLLKHIGMEEKILLPAAQAAQGSEPLPFAAQLRLEHGAIAALLVPSPTPQVIRAVRAILVAHNRTEEAPGGVYETCDRLVGAASETLLAHLRSAPEVPAHQHVDGPRIIAATRRALERAGFTGEAERLT